MLNARTHGFAAQSGGCKKGVCEEKGRLSTCIKRGLEACLPGFLFFLSELDIPSFDCYIICRSQGTTALRSEDLAYCFCSSGAWITITRRYSIQSHPHDQP